MPGSDRQKVAARSSFARAIRPMVLFGKSSQGLIFVGSGRSHRPVGHQNVIAVESQAAALATFCLSVSSTEIGRW